MTSFLENGSIIVVQEVVDQLCAKQELAPVASKKQPLFQCQTLCKYGFLGYKIHFYKCCSIHWNEKLAVHYAYIISALSFLSVIEYYVWHETCVCLSTAYAYTCLLHMRTPVCCTCVSCCGGFSIAFALFVLCFCVAAVYRAGMAKAAYPCT